MQTFKKLPNANPKAITNASIIFRVYLGGAALSARSSVGQGIGSQASVGSPSGEYRRDCFQHDADVQPEGPIIDVLEIQLHPFIEIDIVPAGDLPKTGDAGLDTQPASLFGGVVPDLLGQRGRSLQGSGRGSAAGLQAGATSSSARRTPTTPHPLA